MKQGETPPKGGDYEVGYGKPPKATQFKKGQASANPKGRPRKPKTSSLYEALEQKVAVTENGRKVRLTYDLISHKAQLRKAAQGDTAAYNAVQRARLQAQGHAPALTAEDIRREEAEKTQKQALSGRFVQLLESEASRKKMGLICTPDDQRWLNAIMHLRPSARSQLAGSPPDLLALVQRLDELGRAGEQP